MANEAHLSLLKPGELGMICYANRRFEWTWENHRSQGRQRGEVTELAAFGEVGLLEQSQADQRDQFAAEMCAPRSSDWSEVRLRAGPSRRSTRRGQGIGAK